MKLSKNEKTSYLFLSKICVIPSIVAEVFQSLFPRHANIVQASVHDKSKSSPNLQAAPG